MKRLFVLSVVCCMALCAVSGGMIAANADVTHAAALDIQARSAYLMDYNTGTVVYAKNEKEHLPIASMVKIMTLLLTMEEIDAGRLAETDMVCASENAASMGGSQAFLDAHSEYAAGELIKSIAVGSANDSCVAMAEHIAGSVEAFVARMNERATQLGMKDTRFVNCTGLPAAEQYCCAHDAARMLQELIGHEKFFTYSKVWMFDFAHPSGRVTQLSNTNKLLRAYEGCDGGKTGFTNEAKYCLAATAKRGNTRLISVVCGAETSKIRNAQNAALFNYGFVNYETKQVITAGVPLDTPQSVQGGKENSVLAVPASDAYMFVKKGEGKNVTFGTEMLALSAPVRKDEAIGILSAYADGEKVCEVKLVSDRTVEKSTYLDVVDEFIAKW